MADNEDDMTVVPIPTSETQAEHDRIRKSSDRDQELEREGKKRRTPRSPVCRRIAERILQARRRGIFRPRRVPAAAERSGAIIAFHAPADLTSRDFGRDLVIEGAAESGAFRIECA